MKKFGKNESNDFRCKHCKSMVSGVSLGTKQRNHCPLCLCSLHVDEKVGDRRSECNSLMKPVGLTTKKDGEIMIVHKCLKCSKISTNRIAGDDDTDKILSLVKPNISVSNIDLITNEEDVKNKLFGF